MDPLFFIKRKLQRCIQYERLLDLGTQLPPPPPALELDEWWQLYREEHWQRVRTEVKAHLDECRRGTGLFLGYGLNEADFENVCQRHTDEVELCLSCLNLCLERLQQNLV